MLIHIRVWRLKGALSPRWTIKAWTLVKWGLGLLPLGALGTTAFNLWSKGEAIAWIVTAKSLVHPASATALVAILLVLLYLYWASSDARARLDLVKICTPSRKSDRGLAKSRLISSPSLSSSDTSDFDAVDGSSTGT
jgi:hypothetical protein